MEQDLLQIIAVFAAGIFVGVVAMLLINKFSSGSASPKSIKREFEDYQAEVERHFEATSNKFKDMTAQYQDLYQHLSVGATSLCRPESVAAALADQRSSMDKLAPLEDAPINGAESVDPDDQAATQAAVEEGSESVEDIAADTAASDGSPESGSKA